MLRPQRGNSGVSFNDTLLNFRLRSVGVQEYNSTETNFTNSEILSKYGGYGTKFYSN